METYTREIACPKCGASGAQTRYVVSDDCDLAGPHLHLRCTSCEYGAGWRDWAVWPMDQAAPVAPTPQKEAPPVDPPA